MSEAGLNSISLPYKYLADRKKEFGKDYSGRMVKMFIKLFNMDANLSKKIAASFEMLMNSILLIDDIEDGSVMRRGRPCAHLVFGTAATINSGNYYYFKFIEQMIEVCPQEKLQAVLQEVIKLFKRLHEGQALEIFYRDNQIVPTEDEYRQLLDLKTTTSIYFLPNILKIFSDSELDFEPLCYLLGQYFQINDDYLNLTDDTFQKMKGFAEDITEGKYSFPIIHALRKDPKDRTISSILRMKTHDEELKKLVIEKLNELGSLEHTKQTLTELSKKLCVELLRIGVDKEVIKLFKRDTTEP